MATIGTFNEEGTNVDLYIPRKCHATNTLITSYDHAAVQISIANVDPTGVIDGTTTTFCIAGYLRAQGEADHAINHLAISRGIVRIKSGKPKSKATAAQKKNAKGGKGNKAVKGGKAAAAAPQKGGKQQGQKNAKPQGKAQAKPQGKPQGKAQGKAQGQKNARPQGKAQAPRKARA